MVSEVLDLNRLFDFMVLTDQGIASFVMHSSEWKKIDLDGNEAAGPMTAAAILGAFLKAVSSQSQGLINGSRKIEEGGWQRMVRVTQNMHTRTTRTTQITQTGLAVLMVPG